jgi:hypothetical protein
MQEALDQSGMEQGDEPRTGVRARPKAAPKALRSLYGASDRQAKDNTVVALCGAGERPQEIYTPEIVGECILKVWPSIELDPCWGPGSVIPAREAYYVPPRIGTRLVKNKTTGKKEPKPFVHFTPALGERSGLEEEWRDYTFVNPPFVNLEEWLAKAVAEAEKGYEIMLLGPTRGYRKWFRAARKTTTRFCELNPLKFEGFKSAFPAPLFVAYWGQAGSVFEEAFRPLGDCT